MKKNVISLHLCRHFVNFLTTLCLVLRIFFALTHAVSGNMLRNLSNIDIPIFNCLIEMVNEMSDIDWIGRVVVVFWWRNDGSTGNNCMTES